MASLHEYLGGHGYVDFMSCTDIDCRCSNNKPGIEKIVRVTSMLQYWEKKRCNLRSERLASTEEPESSEYVKQIMDDINAETPDKTSAVADAVVF
jgi:hypothetical protein